MPFDTKVAQLKSELEKMMRKVRNNKEVLNVRKRKVKPIVLHGD